MDRTTQTNLNTQRNRDALSDVFPDLKNDVNFEILSPQTPKYNCIAWAMQFEDRWVDIFEYPGHWWPDGVEKTMSPSALIHAFEAVGFNLCDNNNWEDGFDKVVLYKKADEDQWTHAARIVSETTEHSKFGPSFDGTHSHNVLCATGLGYENQSYGVAYAFMKRSKTFHVPEESLSGNIKTDLDLFRRLLGVQI